MTELVEKDTKTISRRKAFARLGGMALAVYTVPAVTTLSMAQASSGVSSVSNGNSSVSNTSTPSDSSASSVSTASGATTPSVASAPSSPSVASKPSVPSTQDVVDICGPENLDDPTYTNCLIENGFVLD